MSLNRLRPIVPTAQVGSFMSSSIGIPSAAGTFRFSSLVPIAWTQLSSGSASVTFSSIPQTYQDLVLVLAGASSTSNTFWVRPNSDTSDIYSFTQLFGNGSSASSTRSTSPSGGVGGLLAGFGNTEQSVNTINIFNYTSTSAFKTSLTRHSGTNYAHTAVSLWRSTSAVTSLSVVPSGGNFAAGSTFALYGVRAS